MTEQRNIITLDGIGLTIDGKRILRGVNWQVQAGQHWAILGANGSGKTTMLRITTGYIWPTAGSVSVLGERFGQVELREVRRRIGWVSSALYDMLRPGQTALQIVLSGMFASTALFDRPTAAQKRRAKSLLQQAGADYLADRPVGVLSLGERQKVLIARALAGEPELLIFDEPCAGLDICARENLLKTIRAIGHQAGRTVVFVTHHVEEITEMFSHVLVLARGKVYASGSKEQVLQSSVLSEAYGMPIELDARYGRYWSKIRNGE